LLTGLFVLAKPKSGRNIENQFFLMKQTQEPEIQKKSEFELDGQCQNPKIRSREHDHAQPHQPPRITPALAGAHALFGKK
jgi:hypothetical protein